MSLYQSAARQPGIPEDAANWCWQLLDVAEDRLIRMLMGIWQFVTMTFPEWFVRFYRAIVRIVSKLVRVGVLVLMWVGISFIPAILLFHGPAFLVLLGLVWIGVSLAGSLYGLMHVQRRIRMAKQVA